MKTIFFILQAIFIILANTIPEDQAITQANKPTDIYQIVDEALIRGELANLLYIGEFHFKNDGYDLDKDGNYYCQITFDTDKLPLAIPNGINGNAWLSKLNSDKAIQNVFKSAFINHLANQYIQDLEDKYKIQDGIIYMNTMHATPPLSLIQWQHQPLKVLERTPEKLTVLLYGHFMPTGNEVTLPLTLHEQNGQWLLDESFSPIEQETEDYYYSQSNLQNIVIDVLTRANKANIIYSPDSLQSINEYNIYGEAISTYELIDTKSQSNEETLKLVQEITTTDDVKKCFTDTFIPETANKYIESLLYSDWLGFPLYKDRAEGLAITHQVATFPITMSDWQANDYFVWQNTHDKIILIMRADLKVWYQDIYRPIIFYNVNEHWLCDDSYGLPSNGWFAWSESNNNFTWK